MISTVKLDDRATAACGSKNGRYELPRLSTSVKDNLWSNKSVTGSPGHPASPLFPDIKISARSSLNPFDRPLPRRLISDAANRGVARVALRLLFFFLFFFDSRHTSLVKTESFASLG